jgi:WD40 repeat-containing protein SMU1
MTSNASSLEIPGANIIQLIQHHLTECGLAETSKTLLKETLIGSRGLLPHAHTHIVKCAKAGDWGIVLELLSTITVDDGTSNRQVQGFAEKQAFDSMLADVHEMAILELADAGEMDLAFATLKICRKLFYIASDCNSNETNPNDGMVDVGKEDTLQSLERRLNAVAAIRSSVVTHGVNEGGQHYNSSFLPPDYWGPNNKSKQEKRNEIAMKMSELIPIIPKSRLTALCQQAIKWQMHTGEMPMLKQMWDDTDEVKDEKLKRKKRQKKVFDLVMGEVSVETATSDLIASRSKNDSSSSSSSIVFEKIPKDPYSTLKLGKRTVVTSCCFLQNGDVCSLITGSSDGFIEIWDSDSKFTELRMDLDYQKKDELMCHYGDDDNDAPSIHAMTVNSNGTMLATGDSRGSVSIWNISTGQCLHTFEKVFAGAVTCLDFARDGEESSRILCSSQDGNCREFGLRTKKMLKEFRGHTSFVNYCSYVLTLSKSGDTNPMNLLVVTASADSTVRIWCGRSAEVKLILNPMKATGPSALLSLAKGTSEELNDKEAIGRNIHTILPLHTPSNAMIIVPRGPKAYLVTYNGLIIRSFENGTRLISSNSDGEQVNIQKSKGDIVCATVSPSNKWFYAVTDEGGCICFDVASGKIEHTIRDFALETTDGKSSAEISGVCHHPLKGMIAAYSSSSVQKRGVLTIWK